jgi:hypothetical protein
MSKPEQISSAYHWSAELLIAISECRSVWSISTRERILSLTYTGA